MTTCYRYEDKMQNLWYKGDYTLPNHDSDLNRKSSKAMKCLGKKQEIDNFILNAG
jgi:hypothetical protein